MCYIICDMNKSAFDFGISHKGKSRTTNTECCLYSESFKDRTFGDASYSNINLRFDDINIIGAIFTNTFELK